MCKDRPRRSRRPFMSKRTVVTACLFFANSVAAQAQTTIDVPKITCDQYNLFKVKDPQKIAIWLSGYYHGTRKDTSVDLSELEARADTLKDYCYENPKVHVMEAAQKVFKLPDGK